MVLGLTFLMKAHSRALEAWSLGEELTAELEQLMAPFRTDEAPRPSRPGSLENNEGAAEREACAIQGVAERALQEALDERDLADAT